MVVDAQHPSYQCPLANVFIATLQIYIHKHPELHDVETVHGCQSHGADDYLLIVGINGWREEQLFHRLALTFRPDVGCKDIGKDVAYKLMMLFEYRPATFLRSVLRLQIQHSHLRHKLLQLLSDNLYRPVARTQVNPHEQRCQEGRMEHSGVGRHVGIEHIHAMQQFAEELWQLGILIALAPVVSHHLIVGLDGKQSVGVNLVRMQSQIILHQHNGASQIAYRQRIMYLIQCIFGFHVLFLLFFQPFPGAVYIFLSRSLIGELQ